MLLLDILIVILLLLTLLLNSHTKLELTYTNRRILVKLIFLSVIKIRLNDKTNVKNHINTNKKIGIKKILNFIYLSRDLIKKLISIFSINLELKSDFYFLSPYVTALLYGYTNAILPSIISYFKNYFAKFNSDFSLSPALTTKRTQISFKAEVSFKNIKLIIIMIKFLKRWFVYGKSYRRTNENNNGQSKTNDRC